MRNRHGPKGSNGRWKDHAPRFPRWKNLVLLPLDAKGGEIRGKDLLQRCGGRKGTAHLKLMRCDGRDYCAHDHVIRLLLAAWKSSNNGGRMILMKLNRSLLKEFVLNFEV